MSHSKGGLHRKLKYVDPVEFTPHFAWKKNASRGRQREEVFCEDAALTSIAVEFGTAAYVYSSAAIEQAYRELTEGLRGIDHTLCFAVKSNGNLSILEKLGKLGSGFDIVSGGELRLLQHIGVKGDRIVFSGVGKSREEIREALNYQLGAHDAPPGILLFNAESEAELEILTADAPRVTATAVTPPTSTMR